MYDESISLHMGFYVLHIISEVPKLFDFHWWLCMIMFVMVPCFFIDHHQASDQEQEAGDQDWFYAHCFGNDAAYSRADCKEEDDAIIVEGLM